MTTLLTILHVLVCVFLIAVVLLQRGKGAQIGAVFGSGASSTVFGGRGAGNFLTRLTTAAAIVFMATSLSLSYFSTSGSQKVLFEDGVPDDLPAQESLFEELETVEPEGQTGQAEGGTAGEATQEPQPAPGS